MPFCVKCGNELEDNTPTCSSCKHTHSANYFSNQFDTSTVHDSPETAAVSLVAKIKSSAIFLGVVYFIAFITLLPYWISFPGSVSIGLKSLIFIITSVIIAHIFLNWLYYLTIAAPLIIAAILAICGWAIWIFSPIVCLFLQFLISIFTFSWGGSSDFSSLTFFNDFSTKLGATLMALSGGLWWLVKKAKDINYKALGVYLFCLSLLGVISGFTSLAGLLIFLVVWLVVYLKANNEYENLPDLKTVFKVVATLAIVANTANTSEVLLGLNTLFHKSSLSSAVDGFNSLIGYKVFLSILLIAGVWKFEFVVSKIPPSLRAWINRLLTEVGNIIRI